MTTTVQSEPTPLASTTPPTPPPTPLQAAGGLPVLRVNASPEQVLKTLDEAARRGRLAGFEHGPDGVLFHSSVFSSPFEGVLDARAGEEGGVTTLRFTTRMKRKLLAVFVAVLLVSIWPGLPITQSLLASLFPSWHWLWSTAAWWYLPLSIAGAPWAIWVAVKRSRESMAAESLEVVGKVEKELGAQRVAG